MAARSARELIRRGADLLLLDAIGNMDGYFSQSYLQELETYSPFRFSFLKEQRADFLRRHGSLGKLMDSPMLWQGKL